MRAVLHPAGTALPTYIGLVIVASAIWRYSCVVLRQVQPIYADPLEHSVRRQWLNWSGEKELDCLFHDTLEQWGTKLVLISIYRHPKD